MTEGAKRKARAELRKAEAAFEREQQQLRRERAKSRAKRRESFERAQKDGLTLREIGEVVGLHHTRVGEILRGE
jgi:hypothetical protein